MAAATGAFRASPEDTGRMRAVHQGRRFRLPSQRKRAVTQGNRAAYMRTWSLEGIGDERLPGDPAHCCQELDGLPGQNARAGPRWLAGPGLRCDNGYVVMSASGVQTRV